MQSGVDVWFPLYTRRAAGAAAEVTKLVAYLLVARPNEAAHLALQGVLHRHGLAAAVAPLRHVLRFEVIPEADVVPPLLPRHLGAIEAVGDG